ncbi:MAG: U32 family peptidase [archaeon]|nr:U32 family peptidase [archaeon]
MEILSPAGNPEGLVASILGGCDAVYLSGKSFGARAFAGNFTDQQLEGAINYAHDHGVKVYVTVNTLIKDSEMDDAVSFIRFLSDIGADAVLIQDLGLLKSIHTIDIKKHASTQMGIHSAKGLEWCGRNGLSRAVLNRELTFEEIKEVTRDSPVETEVFVGGALCYCLSGGCLFSSLVGGRSGNRGSCAQPCRKRYAFDGEKSYTMSCADIYGVDWLKRLEEIGVTSAKIEGRMRSQAYAYLATRVYSSANRGLDPEEYANDVELLKTVFNRGYGDGYFAGADKSPVQRIYADNRGQYLGKATFRKRKFSTDQLDVKVGLKDGLTLYNGDEKMGGFKLTSVGNAASPFDLPDGTYDVYRTYDPRIDTVKNLVGEAPKFTGSTERTPMHVPIKTVQRAPVDLPEMSFYVSSIRNLNAVLPHAHRVYYEMCDTLPEAQEICDNAGVEIVTHTPRFAPLEDIEPNGRPLMINTPGQYIPQKGDRIYASQFMNVFNSYHRMPFHQVTLSPELSNEEIRNIANHYPGRLEVMVYGRQELMCTRDPAMHNGTLIDEKAFRFPVYKDSRGLSHILNSSDTMLLPYLKELGRMGVESVGIDVRKRPENIVRKVAEIYANNDLKSKFDLQEMCGGLNYGAYLRGTD